LKSNGIFFKRNEKRFPQPRDLFKLQLSRLLQPPSALPHASTSHTRGTYPANTNTNTMPRGVTTAKTGSKVNMNDGTASDYQRPKSARMSVCQRATESSAAGRNQATANGKSSTVLAFGGKLADNRGQVMEGSMSRRGPAARSEVERSLDSKSFAATTASSSIRTQVPAVQPATHLVRAHHVWPSLHAMVRASACNAPHLSRPPGARSVWHRAPRANPSGCGAGLTRSLNPKPSIRRRGRTRRARATRCSSTRRSASP